MKTFKKHIQGPLLAVISAPSGTGKTTISRELCRRHRNIRLSISATTRPRAKGERQGRDYFFMNPKEFETKLRLNWFAEWARVYGHYYGTPLAQIKNGLTRKRVILFDVDVQGGKAIKRAFPEAVTIFLLPPSMTELKRRLFGRRRDTQLEINKRLALALKEIKMRTKYDYTVINADLDKAIAQVESILEAESLRSCRAISGRLG